MLREMEKNKGARGGGEKDAPRGRLVRPRDSTPKLSELGISKTQSSRWQMLADLKPDEFEAKVDRAKRKAVSVVDGTAREVIREVERAKYAQLKRVGGTVSG